MNFPTDSSRPAAFQRFERGVPHWYTDAKLGIFMHWGPYSVPAWAEPIGPLGTFEETWWMAHNPYAEWYFNTIRIEGSPAREHQLQTYGSLDYEQFLDAWHAESFDADTLLSLIAASGAKYFVPTTKHHDGVTLWDAPGTGTRNTVHRGPKRDLVGELRQATLRHGLRFGAYYSGGLDWHVRPLTPLTGHITDDRRPLDAEYAAYAFDHVIDLVDRYEPAVLWGDIEWPDAGKEPGRKSLASMFEHYYDVVPDGVVNDRWGMTHWDFRTSEYQQGLALEQAPVWENDRGIGFSFGYNQLEDETHYLTGPQAIRHFVDIVSRGGNLLLNIGPTASGQVPAAQERTLRELGTFNAAHGDAIFGSRPIPGDVAEPSDAPWVRWTGTDHFVHAFVAAGDEVELRPNPTAVALDAVTSVGAEVSRVEGGLLVRATADYGRVTIPRR